MQHSVQFRMNRIGVFQKSYIIKGSKGSFKWYSNDYMQGITMKSMGVKLAKYGPLSGHNKDRTLSILPECELPVNFTCMCFVLVDLWANLYSNRAHLQVLA